ncbi:MAG TPA: hypothetical protein VJ809_12990, partial [Pirellulales bacterium]|nr:hypothetical protein [Pirellulales bacterium]
MAKFGWKFFEKRFVRDRACQFGRFVHVKPPPFGGAKAPSSHAKMRDRPFFEANEAQQRMAARVRKLFNLLRESAEFLH